MPDPLKVRCTAHSTRTGLQCKKWADFYAELLQDAYEAAERLAKSTVASDLAKKFDSIVLNTEQLQALQQLDEVFLSGGVSALVGKTWGAVKDMGVYATGEAIRGLADLERKERELCANFAAKAIAAGLAERQVRLAERQGELMVTMLAAALAEAGLTDAQSTAVKVALAHQVRALGAD